MDQNLLSRLRAKREALGKDRTIIRPVPGYDGDLAVRYRYVPYEELAAKGRNLARIKDPTRRDLLAAADTLATLCDEILIHAPDSERADKDGYVPLAEPGDDFPIRFGDERLGQALGFEVKTARDGVFGVFQNDYAVLAEAVALSAWLQDTSKEVDEAFSGS